MNNPGQDYLLTHWLNGPACQNHLLSQSIPLRIWKIHGHVRIIARASTRSSRQRQRGQLAHAGETTPAMFPSVRTADSCGDGASRYRSRLRSPPSDTTGRCKFHGWGAMRSKTERWQGSGWDLVLCWIWGWAGVLGGRRPWGRAGAMHLAVVLTSEAHLLATVVRVAVRYLCCCAAAPSPSTLHTRSASIW
jgi:hypothetical protein